MEEDRYLYIGRYWRFPEQLQVVKEAEGKEKLGTVGTWGRGLGVAKGLANVMAKVIGKTISGLDAVWNVGLVYLLVKSKAEVVDEGEEHVDEVGVWQIGVVALDGAPKQSKFISLVASDHRLPQFDEDIQ